MLVDRHGRVFDYLRVSLLERCNLRCIYCMPERGLPYHQGDEILRQDELLRLVRVLARGGVSKVRLSGGEPLLRPDVVEIVRGAVQAPGVTSVHLTTNGLRFSQLADALRAAGLHGVNISLDSLQPRRFLAITRRPGLDRVLAAIHCAVELGFPEVKINVVALRGVNDDELPSFAELTRELPVTVRFIELMPFDAHQVWRTGRFLSAQRMVELLHRRFSNLQQQDAGSATEQHCYRLPGAAGRLAVIPAYTRSFCGACSRIRLTADGQLRNCLYSEQEYDLRALIRRGCEDHEIIALVHDAMAKKLVDGWAAQRGNVAVAAAAVSGTTDVPGTEKKRESMTQIGG